MYNDFVKIKYIGTSPVNFNGKHCPFVGRVNPGDVINVSYETFESDLKNDSNWEVKKTDIKVKQTKEEKE